jgi:hypothetical protein
MRITEVELRHIIRDEIKNVIDDKLSILPSNVSTDLFVKHYNACWGGKKENDVTKKRMNIRSITKGLKDYSTNNRTLTDNEVQEAFILLNACLDGGEYNKYNIYEVLELISKIINVSSYDLKLRHIKELVGLMGATRRFVDGLTWDPILNALIRVVELKTNKTNVDPDNLEKGIEFMNSLQNFAEQKELDEEIVEKLKELILSDIGGMQQAAELYSML